MSSSEKKIGKYIREVRIERNLSQEKLAEMCGFSNTTLSSYENDRSRPSLDTIMTIAKELKVPVERLYYGDENISFINSEPNEGRKIVNAIYFLWKSHVIYYFENYMPGMIPMGFMNEGDEPSGVYLQLVKYCTPLKRLINSLNEFQRNEATYPDPEKYLDILLTSVAKEINNEIEEEKADEEKRRMKAQESGKSNNKSKGQKK